MTNMIKMNRLSDGMWLQILVLLSLALLTIAQAESPEAFERKTKSWMEEGNLSQIAWTVRYYRESAQQAFRAVLERQTRTPTPCNERWLNTIARAFRLEGMGCPNELLAKRGYLWPVTRWRGTMFEADGAQGEHDLHGTWDN
jgi:hypothetical protein